MKNHCWTYDTQSSTSLKANETNSFVEENEVSFLKFFYEKKPLPVMYRKHKLLVDMVNKLIQLLKPERLVIRHSTKRRTDRRILTSWKKNVSNRVEIEIKEFLTVRLELSAICRRHHPSPMDFFLILLLARSMRSSEHFLQQLGSKRRRESTLLSDKNIWNMPLEWRCLEEKFVQTISIDQRDGKKRKS